MKDKKNAFTYTLTENNASNTAYGLAVFENGKLLESIDDISFDRKSLNSFANLLNDEQLDPIQFEEAVEDFIAK